MSGLGRAKRNQGDLRDRDEKLIMPPSALASPTIYADSYQEGPGRSVVAMSVRPFLCGQLTPADP